MKLDRGYCVFLTKSVDEEQRIVEGVASTIHPDRQQDIVVPAGAKMSLPLPFLYQHNPHQPIGHVIAAKVTDAGIEIRAQIAKGIAFIDDAWALIKAGLVAGLSLGFRPLTDPVPIAGTQGLRFDSFEILEISAVTIPANMSASITSIKSADQALLAASANRQRHIVRAQTLAELEAEFGTSTTMTPETFAARRKAILKRAAAAPAPVAAAPAPAPATLDDRPITKTFFDAVLRPVVAAVGEMMKEENAKQAARIKELQNRVDKSTTALESAERRLSRHATHLAALEDRLKKLEHK